jgi:hypothetical protein
MSRNERNKKGHYTRDDLLKKAGDPKYKLAGHLAKCKSCRQMAELLKRYNFVGQLPLDNAPEGWVRKAIAIVEKPGVLEKAKGKLFELVFDSWLSPEPVGVRGTSAMEHRRLRFGEDDITFDLRAERYADGWKFIASAGGLKDAGSHLKVDKKEYFSDDSGIYQWSSLRPPRKIALIAGNKKFELPELKWKKARKK